MHGSISASAQNGWLLSALVSLLALGCSASSDVPSALGAVNGGAVNGGAAGAAGANAGAPSGGTGGAGGSQYRERSPQCRAPVGVSNNPQSIADTVTLLNALPKPLTLPCFLESLARPLAIVATNSLVSAQPAGGARSPRMFLFFGPNRMSIVPDGVGASLLEFGEVRPDYRSLKAEIQFPLTADVPAAAPFDRVMYDDAVTTCGFCHANEVPEPTTGLHAFVSQSLRPDPRNAVTLQSVQYELGICDRTTEPDRCAMLDSLFSLGAVTDAQFPPDMPIFD